MRNRLGETLAAPLDCWSKKTVTISRLKMKSSSLKETEWTPSSVLTFNNITSSSACNETGKLQLYST